MTSPRYLLCPGWVTSQTDGQSHYVGAHELARLYGVRKTDCIVAPSGDGPVNSRIRAALMGRVNDGELVALYPRYGGGYQLPDSQQERTS